MKIDATKYNAMVANASSGVVIDDNVFKNFIGDAQNVIDHNSPEGVYAADAGTTDDYAVTLSPVPAAYFTGMAVRFKANTANTGAATLNVNSLGAKTIKKFNNLDLDTGDIKAGQPVEVMYDGTNFYMLSPLGKLMQEGETTLNVAVGGTAAVSNITFPVAFASTPKIQISIKDLGAANAGYVTVHHDTVTTTGFAIRANSYIAQNVTVVYRAIG